MFLLTNKEVTDLRYQIGTSSWGGRRYSPLAFTEHGILLNSHLDLKQRIDELEKKYDQQFQVVFKAIKAILDDKDKGNFGNQRFEIE